MAIVTKTQKSGRQYRYAQHSYRVGGKVKTKSVYLGPVNPKRTRKPGVTVGEVVTNILMGGLAFAASAATGKLATPHYKPTPYDEGWREKKVLDDQLRRLDEHYLIDKTNAERFNETRARLPREMFQEYSRAQLALTRTYQTEKERHQPKADTPPAIKEFADRLASRADVVAAPPAADAIEPDADESSPEN
jgi:hypothetical protein